MKNNKNIFSGQVKSSLEERAIASKQTQDSSFSKEEHSQLSDPIVVSRKYKAPTKKHSGGRPTFADQGKERRKQYTLTLTPSFYQKVMTVAEVEGISFSLLVERALRTYKKELNK